MIKLLILSVITTFLFSQSLDTAVESVTQTNKQALSNQKKIDALDTKNKQLFNEYIRLTKELENQKKYNKHLSQIITSQNDEMQILNSNINNIDNTSKNIYPLMERMVITLEEFIQKDTPFLLAERLKRVEKLKTILKRSDMSISNKYRSILESYMIENDYSNNIESYSGKIQEKVVEFLRVGRVGLYYISKDNSSCGMYDKTTKKFITLDNSNIKHIKKAIKIAKKQLAPDLIVVPVNKG